jgi:hydroxyacylglutathione hydrolase
MLFERIESAGLAHYSYLIGDGHEAAVIDPRRDCEIYVEKASREGMRITTILETHRNEDYVIGSVELAKRTGAEIWHADPQLDYRYGQAAREGQEWRVGGLKLKAIHSPGHTPGSMSYLLHDPGGNPWIVFTGDALFAGDVGRVDLLGVDRAQEMAGQLYETIFGKLLPLGDEVIVCPAHGPGSVCGSEIAQRPWTTIGIERKHNPRLQHTDRADFTADVAKELERPPYFEKMEVLNLEGAPVLGALPAPPPLSADEFAAAARDAVVVDTRSETAFSGAHVPGSLSMWLGGLPSFAGWFLGYQRPILLVNETDDPTPAVRYLVRLGYDNIAGCLAGGMLSWHMAGRECAAVSTVTVHALCGLLDSKEKPRILDVRSADELEKEGRIAQAQHIHITQLPEHLEDVPRDRTVYVFCGSGLRSMTAASLLQRAGHNDVVVVLGGLAGWKSITCPIELARSSQ